MKLNLNLLNKFVNISNIKKDDLITKLTNSGFEIEGCEPAIDCDPLIIGQVEKCEKDKKFEKVNICKINIKTKVLEILTTAQNVKVGDKVVVAVDGTEMRTINKKIVKSKVYDHVSDGMLVGLAELGIKKEFLNDKELNGLIILDKAAPVGSDFFQYIEMSMSFLEVSITPNRIDVYNYLNFAKEFSALFKAKSKSNIFIKDIKPTLKNKYDIKLTSKYCDLFSLSEISNVTVKESPLWIKLILWKNGINTINNIVDAGNLVTIILNQPVHVFDQAKLSNKTFEVKEVNNQKINLLNNREFKLDGQTCIVNNEPLSIAGIIGGVDSSVTESTKDIVLEVATFDVKNIRDEQKQLGFSTDSSIRFSRGVNSDEFEDAHKLFWSILSLQMKDIKVSNIINKQSKKFVKPKNTISVLFNFIKDYSSIEDLKITEVENILKSLSFECELKGDLFNIIVPSFRRDVTVKEDIVEEIVRFVGYERVVQEFPKIEINIEKPLNKKYKYIRLLKSYLVNHGIYETINYSLTSEEKAKEFNILFKPKKYWKLQNEISVNRTTMRASTISSLLEDIVLNNNKQIKNINIFEISKLFFDNQEEMVLSIATSGILHYSELYRPSSKHFYALKGLIEGILELSKLKNNEIEFRNIEENDDLHFGKSAFIYYKNIQIGYIGEIHPLRKEKYKLKNETFVCELNVNMLYEIYEKSSIKARDISVFPKVSRDISLEIKKNINSKDILKYIKNLNLKNLIESYIFDVYEKDGDDEFKSIAIRFEFQDHEKTLSDSDVNIEFYKIQKGIESKFKAKIK